MGSVPEQDEAVPRDRWFTFAGVILVEVLVIAALWAFSAHFGS